jgi:hypothetical protein
MTNGDDMNKDEVVRLGIAAQQARDVFFSWGKKISRLIRRSGWNKLKDMSGLGPICTRRLIVIMPLWKPSADMIDKEKRQWKNFIGVIA